MRLLGVTLIELTWVLAIIAVLVCVSMPVFYPLSAQVLRQRCVDEWSSVLHYARIQALMHQRVLRVYPISANNWALGVQLKDGDTVLREWAWHHPTTVLIWHGFRASSALMVDYDLARLAMNGYFNVEYAGQPLARIVVTRFGRVY